MLTQRNQHISRHNREDASSTNDAPRRFATPELPPTLRAQGSVANGGGFKESFVSAVKIAGTGLLSLVLVLGLAHIGTTVSVYQDIETSLNNFFIADPLEFTITVASTTLDMSQVTQQVVPLMTPAEDSEPIQYFVSATVTGGDKTLCSNLSVLATAPFIYDGPLSSLVTATTTDTGPWALTISAALGATLIPNTSCTVDLVYTGWNANALWGQGYKDVEKVSLTFYIPATTTPAVLDLPVDTTTPDSGVVEGTSTENTPPIDPPADASSTPPIVTAPSGGGGGSSTIDATETPPATPPADTSETASTTPETPPPADTSTTTPSTPPPADPAPTDTPPADPPPSDTSSNTTPPDTTPPMDTPPPADTPPADTPAS